MELEDRFLRDSDILVAAQQLMQLSNETIMIITKDQDHDHDEHEVKQRLDHHQCDHQRLIIMKMNSNNGRSISDDEREKLRTKNKYRSLASIYRETKPIDMSVQKAISS